MADSLKDLYNTQPMLTNPKTVQELARVVSNTEGGEQAISGGTTDALRHLLGAATATRLYGPSLAETMLNWHENPNVFQWAGGGYGQRDAERLMDLHNNALGMEIGKTAKSYDEALQTAKRYVKEGRIKLAPPEPPKPKQDIPEHDKNVTFKEWWNKYTAK